MVIGAVIGPYLIALVSEAGGYRDAALGYFNVLIFALPGFFLAYGGNGILQAHGDSVSMQRAMMVAFLANIGLNPLMMYGVPGLWSGMGFNGIAVATVISQTGVMLFILSRVFRLDIMRGAQRSEFMPNLSSYRAIIAQLLPASTAMMVMFVSGFVGAVCAEGVWWQCDSGLRYFAQDRTDFVATCFGYDGARSFLSPVRISVPNTSIASALRCGFVGN